jgi:hypothetical protein
MGYARPMLAPAFAHGLDWPRRVNGQSRIGQVWSRIAIPEAAEPAAAALRCKFAEPVGLAGRRRGTAPTRRTGIGRLEPGGDEGARLIRSDPAGASAAALVARSDPRPFPPVMAGASPAERQPRAGAAKNLGLVIRRSRPNAERRPGWPASRSSFLPRSKKAAAVLLLPST